MGAFCPGLRHQPGQNGSLLSWLVVPTGTKGPRSLLSRLEPPTGTKVPPFVPVRASNRDKSPLSSPLARLAVGPGTKATYCLGPKSCRDKWPGIKACSVVVASSPATIGAPVPATRRSSGYPRPASGLRAVVRALPVRPAPARKQGDGRVPGHLPQELRGGGVQGRRRVTAAPALYCRIRHELDETNLRRRPGHVVAMQHHRASRAFQ